MTSSVLREYDTPSEDPAGSPAQLDAAEQQSWQRFLDASTLLLETLNRELKAVHQLTLYDVLLLDRLAKSEGGAARMSDLANDLVLIPSRVTAQIRRLETQGLVHRQACRNDRRSVIARIPSGAGRGSGRRFGPTPRASAPCT